MAVDGEMTVYIPGEEFWADVLERAGQNGAEALFAPPRYENGEIVVDLAFSTTGNHPSEWARPSQVKGQLDAYDELSKGCSHSSFNPQEVLQQVREGEEASSFLREVAEMLSMNPTNPPEKILGYLKSLLKQNGGGDEGGSS